MQTIQKEKKQRVLGKKFFSYYKPYMGLFLMDMFCALVVAAISLVYPLLIRYITNNVLVNNAPSEAVKIIIELALVFVGLILIEFACNYFITYKGHSMGVYMEHDLRNELFAHFQKLSFGFYNNQKTGQLMSRLTNDLFNITELFHHGPEDIIISLIKFIGAFVILLRVNWKMTLIVFACVPPMLIFAYGFNILLNKAYKRNRVKQAEINATIEDNLSGIRVVKSFANEAIEIEKFGRNNDEYVESKRNSYRYMAGFHSGLTAFTTLITVVVIVSGALFMAGGDVEVTDLLTYLLYISNLTEPVKKLINFTEQFQEGITGYERFLEILAVEPEIQDKPGAIALKNVRGDIRFDDVSFKYADANDYVLSNINLDVKAGEYIALVGTSGVGKTTLCNLIPRFFEATAGAVLVDGMNVKDITTKSLRDNIGMVQQDVYLFAGTVIDNIRYGRPDATDDEVIDAAKNANAHEFIMELPEGYHTNIGQRGVKLSGGQKQRLSIARVFLKNPPVLIFDEATSALDNESEHVVQESLEKLAKNRTTFVIAHRLSTIKNAEKILVLTGTGIAESGSHRELMDRNGIYAGLYNLQFSNQCD